MDLQIACDVTEYRTTPPEWNEKVIFSLDSKSLIISFCNKKESVVQQSEISFEDAYALARIILNSKL